MEGPFSPQFSLLNYRRRAGSQEDVVFAKLQRFLLNMPREWSEVLGGQVGTEPPLND